MTTTIPTKTDQPGASTCPDWCELDHAALEEDVRSGMREDPWHHRQLAKGVETDTHGPLYEVSVERGTTETRLHVSVESLTLGADQAEVLGLALIRAANILRTCDNAANEQMLTTYWDGSHHVQSGFLALPPTAAEIALGAL